MIQEVFYWIFNMSITAAVTGLLIMLVRPIKKIPRRIEVFLWLIPFLRMAIPFGLNSPYGLMSLISRITTKTIVIYKPAGGADLSMTNITMAADSYFPITYKASIFEKVFGVASVIWLIVFLAILLMLALIYFTTLHEMKDAAHLRNNIYFSDKVTSPAVYGIIKPKIILPSPMGTYPMGTYPMGTYLIGTYHAADITYKEKDIELIIMHEKMHIRRADNLWRMLALLIVAAHWFNPLCWVFLKLFLADLEMSCDERVLVKLGDIRAKEYALSLLEIKESENIFASAFGGAKIKTRIENILSFRKMTRFSLTVFIVLIVSIFYVLLTNAG